MTDGSQLFVVMYYVAREAIVGKRPRLCEMGQRPCGVSEPAGDTLHNSRFFCS